jgi:hypothetical protein
VSGPPSFQREALRGLRVTAAYSSLNFLVQYLLYALNASAADDLTSLLE